MGLVKIRVLFIFIFVAVCYSAHFTYGQRFECYPDDFDALNGFSEGLERVVDGWSAASLTCCNWPGVKCGAGGGSSRRVVKLDLGNMTLRGRVSESLPGLDQLRLLNLSFNFFTGELPPKLFHMQHLEVMDLSNNRFSGSIPSNNSLPSLQSFNISFNAFAGILPHLTNSSSLQSFNIGYNRFAGAIHTTICTTSPQVAVLQLSENYFSGRLPLGFGSCRFLLELSVDSNELVGSLPDDLFQLSSLQKLSLDDNSFSGALSESVGNLFNLVFLDISLNNFSGRIPTGLSQLGKLVYFSAYSNRISGQLPLSFSNLTSLQWLNLRNNSLGGGINLNCSSLASLATLDLGSNNFTGRAFENLAQCKELRSINLSKNNIFGSIPESFKNLQFLSSLTLTNIGLSNISSALMALRQCRNLTTLVLTNNFHGEEMPMNGIVGFQSIKVLVLPNCQLSGSFPLWLRSLSNLNLVDLSWNRLHGTIPEWIGNFDHLFYLDLSNNSLSGELPKSLTTLNSIISRNISKDDGNSDIPFFVRRNSTVRSQYNQFMSFPSTLGLANNNLTGIIWPDFGNLKKLVVFDLSRNNLSGPLPDELSDMKDLECLNVSFNALTGSIPASFTKLNFLASFDVSHNRLSGPIPTGGQFSTFPNASFADNLDLCGGHLVACQLLEPCLRIDRTPTRNKSKLIGITLGVGLGTLFFLMFFAFLYVSRIRLRTADDPEMVPVEIEKHLEVEPHSDLILLFQNKDNSEFTIEDLLKCTNNFDQANIIGCGGFGLVYKAILPDGRKVAIKKLSGDYGQMEREFQAEVETLSGARHKNLVLLEGYCRHGNDRMLIYTYMEKGSLDYWLHERIDSGTMLEWDTRLRIAQGASRGLAYLHLACQPHILHRDIKSSNILLDENFEAHLADFGLARLIEPYDTHVTTDVVGTLGYIPPEYSQSPVATFKGDVYSFGVVLLELLTGKRPVDVLRPKGCRDVTSWVLQMKMEKREKEVFDPFIHDNENEEQLLKVLEIACLCLNESPKLRPFVQQIVAWLDNVRTAS